MVGRLKERYNSFKENDDSARRNLKVKKKSGWQLVTESVQAFQHSILRTVEPDQEGSGEKTVLHRAELGESQSEGLWKY